MRTFGTLLIYGSLHDFGTLVPVGSLQVYGTLCSHESFSVLGTLHGSGSLLEDGTLQLIGALISSRSANRVRVFSFRRHASAPRVTCQSTAHLVSPGHLSLRGPLSHTLDHRCTRGILLMQRVLQQTVFCDICHLPTPTHVSFSFAC